MNDADERAPSPSNLPAELRIALSRLIGRLRAEAGTNDLTSSQKLVLLHLEKFGTAHVSSLAKITGVRPQSMGATVASLEAADLVRGEPDPVDGRRTLFTLTEACRGRLAASRAAKDDWLHHAIDAKLDSSERAELARAVRLIARLVE